MILDLRTGAFAHGPGRAKALLRGPIFGSGSVASSDGVMLDTATEVGAVNKAPCRRFAALPKPFPKFTLRRLCGLTRGASVSIM